ncbi:3-isopropylmalate dehydratase small subunit [Rhodococcus opacus]|uniref:3-isopropylmalate dehydratase small subunit n=1 Tax=Rhodococcus opacus TaxID=37919 RepID=A0AAX3YFT9_RHOOP|nr:MULTISPECIES: 3-isopropylmalate dehydratase small subunit [Rhodococcus]MCZ4587760.1 3-isopropylmalate dehydratase small subunit [Rhodococcus opacus]MDI9940141.1 3-isopropylmalate dehydratase small subunit [Rhodococcus sp. IEGM 1351]MDV6242111.1 3-isopropylmalate dehydratase small subunit [Rhodococcus opacus]UNM99049.1 3-isopropylmalate dehydratase small subunit [Rhodococcus opacus]WLF46909.1 3-isopropylmalate dehydratase small subunit [Rhodococcus opacus]
MQPFTVHTGIAAPLRRTDVDTDQIIPVRFLTHSSRTGFSDKLFHDWREEPDFVLNDPAYAGSTILIAGRDFGTGSSREYAVWALQNYGFRAVIAPRFGDIFRGNALTNGLLTVALPTEIIEQLWAVLEADPGSEVTIDLVERQVRAGQIIAAFQLDDNTRWRLLEGLDHIDLTLTHAATISDFEHQRRPALPATTLLR